MTGMFCNGTGATLPLGAVFWQISQVLHNSLISLVRYSVPEILSDLFFSILIGLTYVSWASCIIFFCSISGTTRTFFDSSPSFSSNWYTNSFSIMYLSWRISTKETIVQYELLYLRLQVNNWLLGSKQELLAAWEQTYLHSN